MVWCTYYCDHFEINFIVDGSFEIDASFKLEGDEFIIACVSDRRQEGTSTTLQLQLWGYPTFSAVLRAYP